MPKKTFLISGRIREQKSGNALTGLRVETWDKDLIFDDLVGSDTTDKDGRFSMTFDASYFQELFFDRRPDLYFRVFHQGELVLDTKNSVLWNIAEWEKEVIIEVNLSPEEVPEKPELSREDTLKLHEHAALTPSELQKQDPQLYRQLQGKALSELRQRLDAHFSAASAELRQHIQQLDLIPLVRGAQPIMDYLRGGLSGQKLPELVVHEGLIRIDQLELPRTFDEFLQLEIPLRNNPLLHQPLRQAATYRLAQFTHLDEGLIRHLQEQSIHPDNISGEKLKPLIDNGLMKVETALELVFNGNLYQWTDGNLELVAAVKRYAVRPDGSPPKSLNDLAASLNRAGLVASLNESHVLPEKGQTVEMYADQLARQIERRFPDDALKGQHRRIQTHVVTQNLNRIQPLAARNPRLFDGIALSFLDLTGIHERERAGVMAAYTDLHRLANRHPGLGLGNVLRDTVAPLKSKVDEVSRRVDLLADFYRLNPSVSIVSLDTLAPHDGVSQLNFGGISLEDRELVLDEIRSDQRMFRVTKSPEHAYLLKEKGYHAAYPVLDDSLPAFTAKTSLPASVAKAYYGEAQDIVNRATANAGTIIERIGRRIGITPIDNTSTEIDAYLRDLPGYADYFGGQAYCNCRHCQSIISPAAYFVDLMEFIETRVTFTGSAPADHPLRLRSRRADLWKISLSCANTHTLVPYLVIIDEILENYVYKVSHPDPGSLPARVTLEEEVYRVLYNWGDKDRPVLHSFHQPFMLPLERLQIYLSHFPITRAEVASMVVENAGDPQEVIPQARLGFSPPEYRLVQARHDDAPTFLNVLRSPSFLRTLYGLPAAIAIPNEGEIAAFDAQLLLAPMPIERRQLSELIQTRFVRGDSHIRILGGRRDAGSVQNDIENIHGLTRESLDRMHRFVRLWKKLPWTIGELDLVLRHTGARAGDELPLKKIASLLAIQQRLKVSVEELCALTDRIPIFPVAADRRSLFDRLFNIAPFDREEVWPSTSDAPDSGASRPEDLGNHQRLLAGLNVSDETLLVLIEHLRDGLMGAEPSGGFPLSLENLSLLYRHARLLALLKLPAVALFQLLGLADTIPSHRIESLSDLEALFVFYDWWRRTRYSLDDLSFITGEAASDPRTYPLATELADELRQRVQETRALIFADTVFASFEGVTEEQSKRIIAINSRTVTPIFAPAVLRAYRVARSADLAIDLTMPVSVTGTPALQEALQASLQRYAPGAPPFTEAVFAGVASLSADQSRDIVVANPLVFEAVVDETLFWLTPEFHPASAILIPSDIPLVPETARAHISRFHVSEVIPTLLAGQLNVSVDKFKALVRLAGYELSEAGLSRDLTVVLQSSAIPGLLERFVERVHRLTAFFRDSAFTSECLEFIYQHGGVAHAIFPYLDARSPGVAFWSPAIADVQAVSRYRHFIAGEDVDLELVHMALRSFDSASTRRFGEVGLDALARILKAERRLVTTLNRIITLASDDRATPTIIENHALHALTKLQRCVELAQYLGVGGEVLELIASADYGKLNRAADAMFTAFRTKYATEKQWLQEIEPFEDKIRARKRDALSDYIIRTLSPRQFNHTNDLFHWFLIDTELGGCARTSRLVAGISSLQLYVQRSLMNLEQKVDGSVRANIDEVTASQWEWRKNYRVWEANRKVFLWPENYILPELRDDKTPLFEACESGLLQQEINAQNVLDAYAGYLRGFEEIARLKISGAYHDRRSSHDVLHLFGVTSTEPPIHYYRTVENVHMAEMQGSRGIVWNPWRKVEVQIPDRQVSPIVFRGRLNLFWVEINTRPNSPFDGYRHKITVKFTTLRLDGEWTPPQTIALGDRATVEDPLSDESELLVLTMPTTVDPVQRARGRNDFVSNLRDLLKGDSSLAEQTVLVAPSQSPLDLKDPQIRRMLIPRHDPNARIAPKEALHLKPKDEYTLTGYRWDRIYPSARFDRHLYLSGAGLNGMLLDFYQLNLTWAPDWGELIRETRLLRVDPDIHFGRLATVNFNPYEQAVAISKNESPPLTGIRRIISRALRSLEMTIINGALSDGIIDVGGDIFYLHALPLDYPFYVIKRLGTTLSERIGRTLFEGGVEALLGITTQEALAEAPLPFMIEGGAGANVLDGAEAAIEKGIPDFTGALGVYFREIFFHVPFLIASRLNSESKFADAQRWYHYIFNPTSDVTPDVSRILDQVERSRREKDRVWQYVEFRNRTLQTLRDQLDDAQAFEAYANDPFNPHAIARLRLGAYQKTIFMGYIDNLLDWGDHLFAQDTMESVNEASLLYVMASDLLGPRPAELGDCQDHDATDLNYSAAEGLMASCGRTARATLENTRTGARTPPRASAYDAAFTGWVLEVPKAQYERHFRGWGWTDTTLPNLGPMLASFGTSLLKQLCLFCLPPNPELLAYWDRVEDRLYKIRHCMNISGVRRKLAIFAPEIDPRLLVRAKAAGLAIEDVLNTTSGNLPPYRFSFLIAKAKEFVGALQGFGSALFAALDKKDAEELARLRLVHQQNIHQLTTRLRDQEIKAAEAALEALQLRKEAIEHRKQFYQELVSRGLNTHESEQLNSLNLSFGLDYVASPLYIASAMISAAPRRVGTCVSTGAEEAAEVLKFFAESARTSSGLYQRLATIAGMLGGNERREEGWRHQIEVLENELKENEKHIAAQEIRRDMSLHSKVIHEETQKQLDETFDFYQEKFSNLALCTWLSTKLQQLYREAYQSAYTMARLTERAFRFERGDDASPLLQGNYWDASRGGLLAGERLLNDLCSLERRYMETHYRSMEIDQAFSLTQIDPAALIKLKEAGSCEFSIPEFFFDLFYPGQYRRRIKSARLTIPCITGPYTNVSATLSLTESSIRNEPKLEPEFLLQVPATRTTTIATSTAQNDSGVFRLDFRDERYMPFEGAGAISSWRLTLPKNFRPFDYATINDVIAHISYEAEYDQLLAERVEELNGVRAGSLLKFLQDYSLPRMFSLRQEFSNAFHRLLNSRAGEQVPIELSEKHFPIFLQGKPLSISKAALILEIDVNAFRANDHPTPETFALTIGMSRNGGAPPITMSFQNFRRDAQFGGLPTATATLDDMEFFSDFDVSRDPETLTLTVEAPGDFTPVSPPPSDPSTLDETKLKDVYLYLGYSIRVGG